MGCHKIAAAGQAGDQEAGRVRGQGEPIPWVRVYKLPEFTYFPHKAHIRAELRVPDLSRAGRDDDDGGAPPPGRR